VLEGWSSQLPVCQHPPRWQRAALQQRVAQALQQSCSGGSCLQGGEQQTAHFTVGTFPISAVLLSVCALARASSPSISRTATGRIVRKRGNFKGGIKGLGGLVAV
jgi:hypothetical protein